MVGFCVLTNDFSRGPLFLRGVDLFYLEIGKFLHNLLLNKSFGKGASSLSLDLSSHFPLRKNVCREFDSNNTVNKLLNYALMNHEEKEHEEHSLSREVAY